MTFNCYACKQEIIFDNEHIGRNGKKIPLDPDTHAPHDCPMREKQPPKSDGVDRRSFDEVAQEVKNDHGNEESKPVSPKEYFENKFAGAKKILELTPEGMELLQASNKYVDHTQGPKLKLKILTDPTPEGLAHLYNSFGDSHNIRFSQYQIAGSLYTIAVFFEEIPLKQ